MCVVRRNRTSWSKMWGNTGSARTVMSRIALNSDEPKPTIRLMDISWHHARRDLFWLWLRIISQSLIVLANYKVFILVVSVIVDQSPLSKAVDYLCSTGKLDYPCYILSIMKLWIITANVKIVGKGNNSQGIHSGVIRTELVIYRVQRKLYCMNPGGSWSMSADSHD